MYIIHVHPIAKSTIGSTLSYFAPDPIPTGTIISVPLRNKAVPALVTGTEEVQDAKARIRGGEFALKKVSSRKSKNVFLPEFIETAERLADYYATHTGAILSALVHKSILDNADKIEEVASLAVKDHKKIKSEKLVLQANSTERLEQYKNLVREELARKHSVFIVVPTIADSERLFDTLKRGIGQYAFLFNSSISKKELIKRWCTATASKHPVLIVATGTFLSIPRVDIGTIVVERENSTTYKTQFRPFLDLRLVADYLSSSMGSRLVLADLPLRVSSVQRFFAREFDEFAPLKTRIAMDARIEGIDMRAEDKKPKEKPDAKKPFSILSQSAIRALSEAHQAGEHSFVYTSRRGLSPLTACRDCGSTVLCNSCKASIILHKGRDSTQNIFVCHACGTMRNAHERCKDCTSWRLESSGIGAELVEEELRKALPDIPLHMLTRDTAVSHKEALKIQKKFYTAKGGILLGTEMALAYITQPVQIGVIASLDALLAIPEWNTYERVHSIVLRIREKTKHALYIQTRRFDERIFTFIENGMVRDFYREELTAREQFGYPPYATFIKLSTTGSRVAVEKNMAELEDRIQPHTLSGISHIAHLGGSKYVQHGFLRLERGLWPQKIYTPESRAEHKSKEIQETINTPSLLMAMRSLPPYFTIIIDPESVL